MTTPPKTYKTEAIVLKHFPIGEADYLLTLYTPSGGKLRAVAKGAQAPAPAFQTGQWDNGPGQHPGLAVATEPDFANPGPLPGR